MNDVNSIQIESLEAFYAAMSHQECSVEWTRFPEGGPGWMGSYWDIDFYLDDKQLSDHTFHDQLKTSLMMLIQIPNEHSDHVMNGEGYVKILDERLFLYFSWTITPVYGHPIASQSGEGQLLLISDPMTVS